MTPSQFKSLQMYQLVQVQGHTHPYYVVSTFDKIGNPNAIRLEHGPTGTQLVIPLHRARAITHC